jgi:hypothetical protein
MTVSIERTPITNIQIKIIAKAVDGTVKQSWHI